MQSYIILLIIEHLYTVTVYARDSCSADGLPTRPTTCEAAQGQYAVKKERAVYNATDSAGANSKELSIG